MFLFSWDQINITGVKLDCTGNLLRISKTYFLIKKSGNQVSSCPGGKKSQQVMNIVIRDIDVIHAHSRNTQEYPLWLITLQPAENMPMRNILFENIRVNWEGQKYCIEVRPQVTIWSNPPEGSIENVIFRNIGIMEPLAMAMGILLVAGAGREHSVNNVKFENVSRNGECTTPDS